MILVTDRAKLRTELDLAFLGPLIAAHRKREGHSVEETCERLAIRTFTLRLWEIGKRAPHLQLIPKIINYLGHDPFPAPRTFGEQLRNARLRLGLSRAILAGRLGLGLATYERWEDDRITQPRPLIRRKLEAFLREGLPDRKG